MRVLQVVTLMDRGGLETMLMNYYRHMDRALVQFDFLTHRPQKCAYDDEIQALGGRIYRLPGVNPLSLGYRRALNGFFREHGEYRLVHAHIDCMSALPLGAAKRWGVPVRIAHSHNASQPKDFKYPVKLLYRHLIPGVATKLFACGQAAGEFMFGDHPFSVLPNAIHTEAFRYSKETRERMRGELGIAAHTLAVGHVGRFDAVKNHAFLLQAFGVLARRRPDSMLLLVGCGELQEEMKGLAAALGILERVRFFGLRADVSALMQAMDIFVFPSLYEGLPLSLVEAQAAGLAVLMSSGVSEEAALLKSVHSLPLGAGETVWAERMLQIAEEPGARENCAALVEEAGYDIMKNAKKLMDFYLSAGEQPCQV